MQISISTKQEKGQSSSSFQHRHDASQTFICPDSLHPSKYERPLNYTCRRRAYESNCLTTISCSVITALNVRGITVSFKDIEKWWNKSHCRRKIFHISPQFCRLFFLFACCYLMPVHSYIQSWVTKDFSSSYLALESYRNRLAESYRSIYS